MVSDRHNREVKISLRQRQRVRERQLNIAVVFVTFLYTKKWTTHRFHFVVYYNDNEYEPRNNTRNEDVSTQKFYSRTRCRCRSEILSSLILSHLSYVSWSNPQLFYQTASYLLEKSTT